METYYKPEDLPKFEEIGKEAPDLAKKFFDYYGAVFEEGELTEREKALIALSVAHAAMYAPQSSFFAELFGTRVRYSGLSVGYQLASVIAGGLSPIIATGLLQQTGSASPVALYIIFMAIVTTVSVYLATETSHQDITDSTAESLVESAKFKSP